VGGGREVAAVADLVVGAEREARLVDLQRRESCWSISSTCTSRMNFS